MGTGADTDVAVTFNANSNDGVITWMEDEDYFQFSDDLLLSTTEKIQFRDTAIYINSSTDGQLDLVADTEIQIAATTVDINGNVDISGSLTLGGTAITSTAEELNILDGVTSTTAELNILDGVTSTAAELNIMDGDTSATSTTVADADRVVYNDAGTMKQVAVTDLDTYISATSKTLTNKTLTSPVLNTGVSGTAIADEDDMSSNSATKLATQQSIKAYVDAQITAEDLDITTDSGTIAIDLDSETLTIAGGTGLDSSATSNTVTLAIDSTVATLTGSQTLTNKTLTSPVLNTGVSGTAILDEDNLASDSATQLATQQSIKAYVDAVSTGITTFVMEDDDGTEVTISDGKEVKFIGSGLTTNWTDTDNGTDGDPYDLTFTVDAAQTGITSILATDLKIGEDNETKIDFETADEIHFYAANAEQVYVADGVFGPQTDSDVDLGTTGVRWKDAYVDSVTVTDNVTVGGDLTVNGTTTTVNSTTVTIDDPIFTLGGDSAPGSDDNKDRGIEFRWHNGTAAKIGFFGYDDSAEVFTFIPDATNSSEVFSGTAGNVVFGNIAGTLTTAAQTNITSVGALDGGSITSGFGAIDTGSSDITTTGTVTGGTLSGTLDANQLSGTVANARLDAELQALAGLTSAADKGIQFTGSGTAGTYDLTTAGKALLDDADAAAQRTTLGLGSAATQDVGTSASNVVQLDGSAKLPAVDGSQLTNIASAEATLTKTFTTDEVSTISLSDNVLVPVVSVTKEVPQPNLTNNAWDINSTTENYTRLNSAPSTTLDFVGFDISTASFSQNFSIASQESTPYGIAFNTDGTKMFIVGDDGDDVNEYVLSTGFNVSTASYSQRLYITSQDTTPKDIAFNSDGTKMFIVGDAGNDVNEYTLTTGFDVSTASYSQNFSVSSQDTSPHGIAFNTDGTKMFIVGTTGQDVNEYALSTGFDVSTASFTDSFSVASQDTSPHGIAFNADGTKMFITGDDGNDVNEYALSTGFDVSTASYTQNFSVVSEDVFPYGIAFNTGGTKMFILGSSGNDVNEYDLSLSLALGSGSFASADVGKTIEANSGAFVLTATDGSVTQTSAPTSYNQVASGSWEMYAVVYNTTDGDLELSGLDQTFDLSLASYTQNFSLTYDPQGEDIAFNTDGTKMFIVSGVYDNIQEYALSTGFNISTASFTDSFSVYSQETSPSGIAFNTDGTKMFIVGFSGDDVNEYLLSTGFDVSTASYTRNFSIGSQDTIPNGIAFNTDGTKMFIVGQANDCVYEYALSTGFNIATASYTQLIYIGTEETAPQGIEFNTDGTKMFICGSTGDDVNEYALSTGFDVSTASYTRNFSVASQDTNPKGIAFSTNGTKMFIVGLANDDVYEYALGSLNAPSGYHAVHTTTSTDSTYWADINSMTADEAAGDGAVHYCVSTDDRAIWKIAHNTNGIRSIVRNNSGTWQYNSNATYGSETWANGATNTELATLQEAMGTSVNRMNKTQLDAVADANHFTLGNDLDLAIIFNLSSGTTVPSSDGVSINYDANILNKGAILGTDYDFDAPAQDKVRITALAANNLKIRVV
jgi:hypothetical protein